MLDMAPDIAALIRTDVSNFDGLLTASETLVQSALERIDDRALDKTGDTMTGALSITHATAASLTLEAAASPWTTSINLKFNGTLGAIFHGSRVLEQFTYGSNGYYGNQFIITTQANATKDHGHGGATDPHFYLHSDGDPTVDGTEYLEWYHDGTNGVHNAATGHHQFTSAGSAVASFDNAGGVSVVRIIGNAASASDIYFGDGDDEDVGRIRYTHGSDNEFVFTTNAGDRMWLSSDGKLGLGTATMPHDATGAGMLFLDGPQNSVDGPHIQLTVATGKYPVVQIAAGNYDSAWYYFDAYWDGVNAKSSSTSGNFGIQKSSGVLSIKSDFGVAVGTGVTWDDRLNFSSTETVFNEEGLDLDFRVESDDDTHIFFVDAANDRIGISTNAPAYLLHGIRAADMATASISNGYIFETDYDADNGTTVDYGTTAGVLDRIDTGTGVSWSSVSLYGLASSFILSGTGTLDTYNQIVASGTMYDGTITALNAFRVTKPFDAGTGVITTMYGLRIDSLQTAGLITNAYGIYQIGTSDLNYLAGATQFGPTASYSGTTKWSAGYSAAETSGVEYPVLFYQTDATTLTGHKTINGVTVDTRWTGDENGSNYTQQSFIATSKIVDVDFYFARGVSADATVSGTSAISGTYAVGTRAYAYLTNSNAGSSIANAIGLQAQIDGGFAGTVTNAKGVEATVSLGTTRYGFNAIINTGTPTTAYGYRVQDMVGTTCHAFYVATMSGATNWGYYNNSTVNNFMGTTTSKTMWRDTNQWISSDAADKLTMNAATTLSYTIGGTERLRLGSAESVFNEFDNDIDFRVESVNQTHMLFVDAGNDRVGIGTNAPQRPLHVIDTTGGGNPIAQFEYASGQAYIEITANAASSGGIYFGDAADTNIGAIWYNNADDSLNFRTNNTGARFNMNSAGAFSFGSGSTSHSLGADGDGFFSGKLEVDGIAYFDADLTLADASDLVLGTTTGTKFGTSTSQKLAFFNSTPIVQPSSTGETTGFTAGSGTGVNDDSTFTGNVGSTAYRISDIVKHLKNLGLIAA